MIKHTGILCVGTLSEVVTDVSFATFEEKMFVFFSLIVNDSNEATF